MHACDGRDLEVVETLFWEEASEPLANRLLKTLLHFPHQSSVAIWRAGVNLLLRSTSRIDKEAALLLMEAFDEA